MADHGVTRIMGGIAAWVVVITGLRAQSLTHYVPWEKPKPQAREKLTVGFLPVT